MVVTHGARVCAPPCVQFMNFLYLPHPLEYGSNLNRIVFYPWNQAWNEVSHLFERMFSLDVEIYRRQRERERGGERESRKKKKKKKRKKTADLGYYHRNRIFRAGRKCSRNVGNSS